MEAVGLGQPLPFAPRLDWNDARTVPVESHSSTYFRSREAKERELAKRATSADIEEIYLSLAEWYRCLAENAEALERGGSGLPDRRPEPTPWD